MRLILAQILVSVTLCFFHCGLAYSWYREDDFDPEQHKNWHLLPPKDKCGLASEQRIIGGYVAKLGSIPWIARIAYSRTRNERRILSDKFISFACGGTLISKYYILTAAHCATNPEQIMFVRLGEHNTNTNPDCQVLGDKVVCAPPVQDILVDKVIQHEEYTNDANMRNDVALLKLEKTPELNRKFSMDH
ncbi:CLIP domain-containing serine protease 2-like [Diaphorina citri]|uniref:CLIP domain-containing serine protease 2-like n=1 Tax=Diaphorina citri TaxID=121845 RepID=A0A3Q0JAS5_DIACI|nr:CLIP domain-containing serine protease 2-like [Diaphorina citri]